MDDSIRIKTLSASRYATTSASVQPSPRRTPHGGSGWLVPSAQAALRQPQDGSLTQPAAHMNRMASLLSPARQMLEAQEADDARLSGTTRSLARRLLGLNVASSRAFRATATEMPTFRQAQPEAYFAERGVTRLAPVRGAINGSRELPKQVA